MSKHSDEIKKLSEGKKATLNALTESDATALLIQKAKEAGEKDDSNRLEAAYSYFGYLNRNGYNFNLATASNDSIFVSNQYNCLTTHGRNIFPQYMQCLRIEGDWESTKVVQEVKSILGM